VSEEKPDQLVTVPTLDDVKEAAFVLKETAVETPLLENVDVNEALSGRLLVKAETAQRTGSFKFRGAYNRIKQLDHAALKRGVIAYSSDSLLIRQPCPSRCQGCSLDGYTRSYCHA
jgi:threonine dehydratase